MINVAKYNDKICVIGWLTSNGQLVKELQRRLETYFEVNYEEFEVLVSKSISKGAFFLPIYDTLSEEKFQIIRTLKEALK